MNGAHDLGGRHGFGPVEPEANEPVFHGDWEKRVYGLAHALGAHELWNLDEDRHATENQLPTAYLASSYYEKWLTMYHKLLVEKGVLTPAELKTGKNLSGRVTEPRLRPADVKDAVMAPYSYHRDTEVKPAFTVDQKVRVRNMMTSSHTRLPGYLRHVVGEIATIHGHHVFPDSNSLGQGEEPKWLYLVRFAAKDVWGHDTRDVIHADLWEPYLEPA